MNIKRIVIVLMAALLTAGSVWAKDEEEVIVTHQLMTGQREALPEKTIQVEMKRLAPAKKADASLIEAITQVMDTIAQEDYQNRTFILMLEAKPGGEVAIAAHSDDIVTRGRQDASIYYGSLEHQRYHFVVLTGKDNVPLLDQTFKRQGKVRFVQEFEFVDFKTPNYPTNVIARWSPAKGLQWQTVIINEDTSIERDRQERPDQFQE
jgi:hypothetical protein